MTLAHKTELYTCMYAQNPILTIHQAFGAFFSHFLKASATSAFIHQKLYDVKCRNLLFMNKMVYDLHSVQLQKFGISISLQPLDTKPLWHVLFLYSLFASSGQYTHRPQILSPLLKECPNLAMARGRSSFVNVYLYIRQIIYIQRTKSIPFSEMHQWCPKWSFWGVEDINVLQCLRPIL